MRSALVCRYLSGLCPLLGLLLAACMLAACVPMRAPLGTMAEPPVLADGVFVTGDGTRLPLREWAAEGPYQDHPRAVIVALHGMSDYSHAFEMPAKLWARQGITTLAYDQRGFGAGPNRGLWAGGAVMRRDLDECVAAARACFAGVPVFVLGESMGGAVVLTALASADPPRVDGAILVAPAVLSRADMPLSYRVALFVTAHLFPGLILSNSAASRVVTVVPSDNIEMLRQLGRDPLFQKKTRADTLFGLVDLMDAARTAPARLIDPPPILLLYGAHDQVIPPAPTKAVIAALDGKAEVRRYPNGYHMLLRDLDARRPQQDAADWVLDHAKARRDAHPGRVLSTLAKFPD
jgi:alpha-beta hydrolase superfamily lysophospholipase